MGSHPLEFPPVLKPAPRLWPRLRVQCPCGSHPESTEFFQALAKTSSTQRYRSPGNGPGQHLTPAELRPRLLPQISSHLWFSNIIWVRGRATLLPIHGQVLSALLMCKIYFGCRVQPPFLGSNSVSNIPPTKQAFLFLFWFFFPLLTGWLVLPRSGTKALPFNMVTDKFLISFVHSEVQLPTEKKQRACQIKKQLN